MEEPKEFKHIPGHPRLGLDYALCGKKIELVSARQEGEKLCHTCSAKKIDAEFALKEDDILRQNYLNMRKAKIAAEEALIKSEYQVLELKKNLERIRSAMLKIQEDSKELKKLYPWAKFAYSHPFKFRCLVLLGLFPVDDYFSEHYFTRESLL